MRSKPPRRPSGAPTLSDVARAAGVSAMTVSRVINREDNVRAATRDAVQAAIEALGYMPNAAARSLAGASQIRLGLLFSNPSASYLNALLVGGLDQASRADVQLVVEKCEPGVHEGEVARRLLSSGIEGLILPPPLCDSPRILDVLAAQDGLAVGIGSAGTAPHFSTVGIDSFEAARAMTAHIVALGHRRIGFIRGNPAQTASARGLAGYREALAAAGIAFEPELVAQGLFTYRSGLDAAEQLLDSANPPSAIFASNDDMAAATVAVAHRRGLDVPGDLTVCGFDDTALATTIWPELTTIRQPIGDMSRAAVDLLLAAVRRRRAGEAPEAQHLVLEHELIRRQSDAAPRRRPPARG
ncbi:LacI family DNA-binding transcriptional regulator [Sphingomonas morindae]|uniref:LacI family DNA-binding transcriptional regulator n=1 Tax=Sphingomonas morindae TaxID=1541170 RepID=A0ABY4X6A3_9SPHN|nr:LacI family DNA-binding transcriptional regulator [Sphingomonas morindae]USI72443.1 LacI family DNA-binding transcriptional regulator [Sphingomonas morindae]